MTTYKYAEDHDQSGSLATVTPQPHCDGIAWADIVYAQNGMAYDQGTALFEWEWGPDVSFADAGLILAALGFALSASAPVKAKECTAYTNLGGDRTAWVTVNAIVQRPIMKISKPGFYGSIKALFTDVDEI
jgi:hypothetical protein